MTFISHSAALRGVRAFADKYDLEGLYSYRFETEEDGRTSVAIYSDRGTFLGYV